MLHYNWNKQDHGRCSYSKDFDDTIDLADRIEVISGRKEGIVIQEKR